MKANYNYTVVKIKNVPTKQSDRTKHLLEETDGVYLAVIQYSSKSCNHCICIDGSRKLIFDSAEETSMPLNKCNLKFCCGSLGDFMHINACTRIVRKKEQRK